MLKDGEYIADILPSTIESIRKEPERYRVKVLALDSDTVNYLEELRQLFCNQQHLGDESDLLRKTYEALQAWLRQLPDAVQETRQLSKPSKDFRNALLRSNDPVFLLLTRIPEIFDGLSGKKLMSKVNQAKLEMESVTVKYRETAAKFLRRALQVPDSDQRTTCQAAYDWANSFKELINKEHPDYVILTRLGWGYETDPELIDSLSDLTKLSRCSVSRWSDDDVEKFNAVLTESIRSIEDYAFGKDLKSLNESRAGSKGMIDLIESRIQDAFLKLKDVAGDKRAQELIASLAKQTSIKKKSQK